MINPPTYERLFPEIEEITIEVEEEGHMVHLNRRKSYKLNKNHVRSIFPCHNRSCKTNHGIDIQPIVTEMIQKKETNRDDHLFCDGWESSLQRDCWAGFIVKISIQYKESSSE